MGEPFTYVLNPEDSIASIPAASALGILRGPPIKCPCVLHQRMLTALDTGAGKVVLQAAQGGPTRGGMVTDSTRSSPTRRLSLAP